MGFHAVVLPEDLFIALIIDDQLHTNVGLILTKPRRFLFLGPGVWTDRVLESSNGNMSAHKKFQLKISG